MQIYLKPINLLPLEHRPLHIIEWDLYILLPNTDYLFIPNRFISMSFN